MKIVPNYFPPLIAVLKILLGENHLHVLNNAAVDRLLHSLSAATELATGLSHVWLSRTGAAEVLVAAWTFAVLVCNRHLLLHVCHALARKEDLVKVLANNSNNANECGLKTYNFAVC